MPQIINPAQDLLILAILTFALFQKPARSKGCSLGRYD